MKCKNCNFEQKESFKFCPDCGLEATPEKSKSDEAIEMIRDTNERIKKLEERLQDAEKKRNAEGNQRAKSSGLLDII